MSYSFFRKLENFKIILGSQSPRRKQLLAGLGLNFEVMIRPVDETIPFALKGSEAAVYLAERKWNAFEKECALKKSNCHNRRHPGMPEQRTDRKTG